MKLRRSMSCMIHGLDTLGVPESLLLCRFPNLLRYGGNQIARRLEQRTAECTISFSLRRHRGRVDYRQRLSTAQNLQWLPGLPNALQSFQTHRLKLGNVDVLHTAVMIT